jgi:hypothetical protein
MTAAKPLARYGVIEGALHARFATAGDTTGATTLCKPDFTILSERSFQ